MRYYLAYGSNLNMKQMSRRCPDARPVGTAVIKDYELLFKGSRTGAFLTIEPKKGARVPVGVWEVSDDDVRNLDIYEGCPTFYYRTEVNLEMKPFKGRKEFIEAFVYIMHEERVIEIPSNAYMETCFVGYTNFGFNHGYLIDAFRKSTVAVKRRVREAI